MTKIHFEKVKCPCGNKAIIAWDGVFICGHCAVRLQKERQELTMKIIKEKLTRKE